MCSFRDEILICTQNCGLLITDTTCGTRKGVCDSDHRWSGYQQSELLRIDGSTVSDCGCRGSKRQHTVYLYVACSLLSGISNTVASCLGSELLHSLRREMAFTLTHCWATVRQTVQTVNPSSRP